MKDEYDKVVKEDRDSILWLQLALSELMPMSHFSSIGKLEHLTQKALMLFQMHHKLPVTREPDEATLQKIKQELRKKNITV